MTVSGTNGGNEGGNDSGASEARIQVEEEDIVRPPFRLEPRQRLALASAAGVCEKTVRRWEKGLAMLPASLKVLELELKKQGFEKRPAPSGPAVARRRRVVDVGGKAA